MSNDTSTTSTPAAGISTETLPPTSPRPRTMFGRRCRYGSALGFVTKQYTDEELTVVQGDRQVRLADPEKGLMFDLLVFEPNGSFRPVKSVHIDADDWVE